MSKKYSLNELVKKKVLTKQESIDLNIPLNEKFMTADDLYENKLIDVDKYLELKNGKFKQKVFSIEDEKLIKELKSLCKKQEKLKSKNPTLKKLKTLCDKLDEKKAPLKKKIKGYVESQEIKRARKEQAEREKYEKLLKQKKTMPPVPSSKPPPIPKSKPPPIPTSKPPPIPKSKPAPYEKKLTEAEQLSKLTKKDLETLFDDEPEKEPEIEKRQDPKKKAQLKASLKAALKAAPKPEPKKKAEPEPKPEPKPEPEPEPEPKPQTNNLPSHEAIINYLLKKYPGTNKNNLNKLLNNVIKQFTGNEEFLKGVEAMYYGKPRRLTKKMTKDNPHGDIGVEQNKALRGWHEKETEYYKKVIPALRKIVKQNIILELVNYTMPTEKLYELLLVEDKILVEYILTYRQSPKFLDNRDNRKFDEASLAKLQKL